MNKTSSTQKEKRSLGLDIIRVIATILVITVHFFLNTKYYTSEFNSFNMYFQSVIRNFCMMCVPLFMILTGYLNNKTEYNKNFYKGLLNILIIWLFYSIIETFALNLINGTTENLNFKNLLYNVSKFNACSYSWYIKMYIGLYLISPIINNSYDKFDEKVQKHILIIMIFISVLPEFINTIFNGILAIPDYWICLYPFAYYILGRYIYKKQPIFNKKYLLLLLFFNQFLIASYQMQQTPEYNNILVFINATLIFLIFYNVNIKNKFINNSITYMSKISLDIYLASSLVDKIVYQYAAELLNFNFKGQQEIIYYAPIIVLSVFILSSIYATIRKKLIKIR